MKTLFIKISISIKLPHILLRSRDKDSNNIGTSLKVSDNYLVLMVVAKSY
jgi:hypothetical protein